MANRVAPAQGGAAFGNLGSESEYSQPVRLRPLAACGRVLSGGRNPLGLGYLSSTVGAKDGANLGLAAQSLWIERK